MRYRIKKLKGSLIIELDGKAQSDESVKARWILSPFLRRPSVKVVLYLAWLRDLTTPEVEIVEIIDQEVKRQGGSLRLCALRNHLRAKFYRNPSLHIHELYDDLESGLSGIPRQRLKKSA